MQFKLINKYLPRNFNSKFRMWRRNEYFEKHKFVLKNNFLRKGFYKQFDLRKIKKKCFKSNFSSKSDFFK